jgi:hypothetical protein
MPKLLQSFCLSLLLSALASAQTAPATAPADLNAQITAEAHRILANLKTTHYQHKTQVDEDRGDYALDCSGLVCRILRKVAPHQLASIAIEESKSRQRAWEFYEAFTKAATTDVPGWRAIPHLADAQPGDLLARRNKEILPTESSGHVMVIDSVPVEEQPGRFRVIVIDSTTRPHADDTRPAGTSGVGRGTIWIDTDEHGHPISIRPRPDAKAPHMSLAIGRVEPLPQ